MVTSEDIEKGEIMWSVKADQRVVEALFRESVEAVLKPENEGERADNLKWLRGKAIEHMEGGIIYIKRVLDELELLIDIIEEGEKVPPQSIGCGIPLGKEEAETEVEG